MLEVEDGLVGEMRRLRRGPGSAAPPAVEPVAMTKRRALISISPTTTVRAIVKRAAPSITCTPRPVNRSLESFGAIAAMTPCT